MPGIQIVILFLQLLAGLAVLFMGRRFWGLFAIVVGFEAGLVLSPPVRSGQDELVALVAALAGAFVGGMLVLLLGQIGVALAGFGVTSYFAFWIMQFFGMRVSLATDSLKWVIIFVLGGGVGMVLIFTMFEYGLIFLSSITGAVLITDVISETLSWPPPVTLLSFSFVFVVGIIAQTLIYMNKADIQNQL